MDEEVQHNINNAMETLEQNLSQKVSKTEQRSPSQPEYLFDKATDPPMNHGDGVVNQTARHIDAVAAGPSPKAKIVVKRSRKRTDILLIVRESLHRESKSLAKEKIKSMIKDRRMQYNPIIKKSMKKMGGRVFRKRMPKTFPKRKKSLRVIRSKNINQHVMRFSPVSSNSESSVTDHRTSSKGSSTASCDTESSGSPTSR